MAILNQTRLNALYESTQRTKTFSQILLENESKDRSSAKTSVFLSHSHEDLKNGTLSKIIATLKSVGVSVYVDSQDSSMPPFTNAETASKLKEAIKRNKKFILLATNRAINSKWCNWELGFGDAQKYMKHIALFPLADNSDTWEGSEYLRIYPRIEEVNGSLKVLFPNGTSDMLKDWLQIP